MGHQLTSNSNSRYLVPDQQLPRLGINPSLRYSAVKEEPGSTPSPELSPASAADVAALHQFQFQFRPPPPHGRSAPYPQYNSGSHQPLYRFGSDSPLTPNNSWPSSSASSSIMNPNIDLAGMAHTMSFDDFEDTDELAELPSMPGLSGRNGSNANASGDRIIRRRSSKACDQCRKSKCKCERTGDNDQCKNCIMMNTPCTFLGPSRKRGPPKGYIDAIEARLHQTEALIGIMLASGDGRAKTLLDDLAKDPLAREIINRVDNSPYGIRGRHRDLQVRQENGSTKNRQNAARNSRSNSPNDGVKTEDSAIDLQSTHPSHDWQDQVVAMIRGDGSGSGSAYITSLDSRGEANNNDRRQRRKISGDFSGDQSQFGDGRRASASASSDAHSDEDDIMDAVGQLSLNEDEQVRYHGKASGLHFLGIKERADGRNEGGIWRFPSGRVWPPLPADKRMNTLSSYENEEHLSKLPDMETQEHLLELYFTYVHPVLPVVHKKAFYEVFKNSNSAAETPQSPQSDVNSTKSSSPFNRPRRRIPTVLLLAMFSIAERYSSTNTAPLPTDGSMWAAGDSYLESAKVILDSTYAYSRPSTCQALLLLGYREIGIGAMAQAWVYVGMAIRMAQDLGMHRSADGWARAGFGGRLFSEWELQERKRIWYSCIIMDKYVSTYIGRPLAIFDGDYDTMLPDVNESEEMENWSPHRSKAIDGSIWPLPDTSSDPSGPGHTISCFNASSTLSALLGRIVVAIYGMRPTQSRHMEATNFERLLDKWYLELPDHLRYDPGSPRGSPPQPHVLTLHMQYWTTVLLLHRPFIRNYTDNFNGSEDEQTRIIAKKKYDLCTAAANHITSIVSLYDNHYSLVRSSVFLCFYVFTASVMHVISLSSYPTDPQAHSGLRKCMDVLSKMQIVWPSAGRALELLRGAKLESQSSLPRPSLTDRQKRIAEQSLDDLNIERNTVSSQRSTYLPARSNQPYRSTSYPNLQEGFLDGFDVGTTTSSGNSLSYFSSNERWGSGSYNAGPFPGSLSTSVLPQQYSTGFDDPATSRYRSQQADVSNSGSSGNSRYPQYWNDISTFPQLGSAFGSSSLPSENHVSNHASSMYLPDQYNLYNR